MNCLHFIEMDECTYLKPCDESATCVNTVGSYTCTCNEGYSGDGLTCDGKKHFSQFLYVHLGIKVSMKNISLST